MTSSDLIKQHLFNLKNEWNSKAEGDNANNENEDLVMFQLIVDPFSATVLQRSDNHLNCCKLFKIVKILILEVKCSIG